MVNRLESDQQRSLFVRAEAWLLGLARIEGSGGGEASDDLDDLLRILFGVWLCAQAIQRDEPSTDFIALTRYVEERLFCSAAPGDPDPAAHDVKLMLLCHRILSEQGRSACGIAGLAHELSVAQANAPIIPPQDAGEAVLLAQLGYRAYPPRVALSAADAGGGAAALLRTDGAGVRAVCDAIAAATWFGLVPLVADREVRESLALVLPIILIASLRHNDLETGTAVLRAIRYVRLTRTRAIRQAITFVADQQQGDGKFGYFAAEIAAITNAQGWMPFDAARQLYLPIAVACIWALAETTVPGFTLVSRSPMGRDTRQPSGS